MGRVGQVGWVGRVGEGQQDTPGRADSEWTAGERDYDGAPKKDFREIF